MSQHHRRTLLALLPAGLLAACAGPFGGPPPPRVRIVDLRPLDATLFEQRWEIELGLEEQAGTGLQVDAMTATVEMNGREFGSGRSDRPFLLPALGERRVTLPLRGSALRHVQVIDAMPLNASGKVLKFELRQRGRELTAS